MTKDPTSTRRSFLKGGALLAAPLAAVAAPAVVMADNELKARLTRLENEVAIRELHQSWLRRVNTSASDVAFGPSVRSIAADHDGEPDAIEVGADGKRASGQFHCVVETETEIPQDNTLAQMARAQGGGFIRRTERRTVNVQYVKSAGAWAIAKVDLASA
ncbi:MAG TPA: hypothetical protein VMB02_02275 [Candidatus Aquilonibacter sp.]|nr:hypothetical protein [Candidatus Aquilonibacter sp.]